MENHVMELTMQTLTVKSTPDHYLVEIDRVTLEQGPALLKEDDHPVAVLLPMEEYRTFQRWQREQQTQLPSMPAAFAEEVAAFEQLKPTLQEQFSGQVVAIYQGRVVATGSDKMAVWNQVMQEYGPVPCYLEWVDKESPRRVRVSSTWVKR